MMENSENHIEINGDTEDSNVYDQSEIDPNHLAYTAELEKLIEEDISLFDKELKKSRAPKTVGSGITPELKEEFAEKYDEVQDEILLPVENEVEKSKWDLEDIRLLDQYVTETLHYLDMKKNIQTRPERIHYLHDKDYQKLFPGDKGGALTQSYSGIFLNCDKHQGFDRFRAEMHEIIHELSHNKFRFEKNIGKFNPYRHGYSVIMDDKSDKYHELMRGFNEGMTEYIVERIIWHFRDGITRRFKLSEEKLDKELSYGYGKERDELYGLMKGIANFKNESMTEVELRFIRGYFSGEMMHLRDIDKVFGKGTLRSIAENL